MEKASDTAASEAALDSFAESPALRIIFDFPIYLKFNLSWRPCAPEKMITAFQGARVLSVSGRVMRLVVALQIGASVAFCTLQTRAGMIEVVAWGDGSSGQTNIPSSFTNIIALAAGDQFGLALRDDGNLINWGSPPFGIAVPANLSNVVQIAVGQSHSLTLKSDGTV